MISIIYRGCGQIKMAENALQWLNCYRIILLKPFYEDLLTKKLLKLA